jgi:hypothetical protein
MTLLRGLLLYDRALRKGVLLASVFDFAPRDGQNIPDVFLAERKPTMISMKNRIHKTKDLLGGYLCLIPSATAVALRVC